MSKAFYVCEQGALTASVMLIYRISFWLITKEHNKRKRKREKKVRHCLLPAEENVNVSVKASGTWSHDSKPLIVETFVWVVKVSCGVKVTCIRIRAAPWRKGIPNTGTSIFSWVMMVWMWHCKQDCRSLKRHSYQFYSMFSKHFFLLLSFQFKFSFSLIV